MNQKKTGFLLLGLQRGTGYLADGEHGIVGFPHGVVDEEGHQFSDLVQVSGPAFLRDETRCATAPMLGGSLVLKIHNCTGLYVTFRYVSKSSQRLIIIHFFVIFEIQLKQKSRKYK